MNNNSGNLLDIFNIVGDLFSTMSKIKIPTENFNKISKVVNDNKKNIGIASGLIVATATVTTSINSRNTSEKVRNSFKEGARAGEQCMKDKFSQILLTQKTRDEFLFLTAKVGTHISKLDGQFCNNELAVINSFVGTINFSSPSTQTVIKSELNKILSNEYTSEEVIDECKKFLSRFSINRNEYIQIMNELLWQVMSSDNNNHPEEMEFYNLWLDEVTKLK